MTKENTRFPYPRRHAIRFILRSMARVTFSALSRIEVVGQKNIPKTGPFLVVANHFHYADPAIVLQIFPQQIEFLGGFHMPNAPAIVTWIPKLWGIYPVHRDGSSREAIRAASAVMKQHGRLGIFPEAGSWASVLRPARPGTAFIAVQTGAPLLPIGITGLNNIFPALKRGRRTKITVTIGKTFGPFSVKGRGQEKRQQLDKLGHEIMAHIAALLPPEKRGCYSDDPKIREAAKAVATYPWA